MVLWLYKMSFETGKGAHVHLQTYTRVPCSNNCHFPLQLQYRADLTWMKGAGCITEGSLNIQQAKKAGDLVSEVSRVLRLLSVCSKVHALLFHYIMWNR